MNNFRCIFRVVPSGMVKGSKEIIKLGIKVDGLLYYPGVEGDAI